MRSCNINSCEGDLCNEMSAEDIQRYNVSDYTGQYCVCVAALRWGSFRSAPEIDLFMMSNATCGK